MKHLDTCVQNVKKFSIPITILKDMLLFIEIDLSISKSNGGRQISLGINNVDF